MIAYGCIFNYPFDNIGLMRTKGLIVINFYNNYRNFNNCNKNIMISAIVTALFEIAFVIAASPLFHTNNFLISLSTLVANFFLFRSILLFLLYSDSKRLQGQQQQQRYLEPIKQNGIENTSSKTHCHIGFI